MPDASQHPLPLDGARPPGALLDARAPWLMPDDDVALGCECANPALQIERWGQEVLAFAPGQR